MFRTTEISDPAFESNHLRYITVKTPHLRGRGDICVFVPPGEQLQHIPLVILLHGVYGSAWVWTHKAGVHFTALQLIQQQQMQPMAIVMPSDGLWGDGSGYLAHDGLQFEKWIVEDVPAAVRENIPAVSIQSPLFISGLSMGGFGALRLGIKYGKQFKAVSAHSAITDIAQMTLFVEEPMSHYLSANKTDHSVWATVQACKHFLPALRFDCGTEDQLIDYNRALHRQLEAANITHLYEEFPGGHAWAYWQLHIRKTLLFFQQHLSK